MKLHLNVLVIGSLICLSTGLTAEIVGPQIVSAGERLDVNSSSILETSGQIEVIGGGVANLMSSSKVILRPGFRASPSSDGRFFAGVDADGDGLSDRWEASYGLNPNSSSGNNGASGNPDNDGLNNLLEYLLGTDPNSPNQTASGLLDIYEPK